MLPENDPFDIPPKYYRFHGGQKVLTWRHRQAWVKDGQCCRHNWCPQDHLPDRRILWRRQLRYVWACLQSSYALHVAQCQNCRNGWRTSRRCSRPGQELTTEEIRQTTEQLVIVENAQQDSGQLLEIIQLLLLDSQNVGRRRNPTPGHPKSPRLVRPDRQQQHPTHQTRRLQDVIAYFILLPTHIPI